MTKKTTIVSENDPMFIDYHHKLSDEEKSFLYKFSGEVHLGVFIGKPMHKKKARKELLGNRNAKRRDVLSVSEAVVESLRPRRGRYNEADYGHKDENQKSPEDAIIAYIDAV